MARIGQEITLLDPKITRFEGPFSVRAQLPHIQGTSEKRTPGPEIRGSEMGSQKGVISWNSAKMWYFAKITQNRGLFGPQPNNRRGLKRVDFSRFWWILV